MTKTELARHKFNRADRLYHITIKMFVVFVVIMLSVIAFEVALLQSDLRRQESNLITRRDEDTSAARARLEAALKETQQQQIVTQNYIRCIGSVLLKPIPERTSADFDACGIPGVTDPSRLGQDATNQGENAPNQQSPSVIPQNRNTPQTMTPAAPERASAPDSEEPVISGPPPDEPEEPVDEGIIPDAIPLIGNLL